MASVAFQYRSPDAAGARLRQWPSVLRKFRQVIAAEYYEADISIDMPSAATSLEVGKTSIGPLHITRYGSPGVTCSRRTWQHIRHDQSELYVIWFVTSGDLSISQNGRQAVIGPGGFAISASGAPFRIVSTPDRDDRHESYQILVPAHMIAGLLPNAMDFCACPYSLDAGPSRVSYRVFTSLFDDGEGMPRELAARFAQDALQAIAAAARATGPAERPGARDGRRELVLDYIDRHLSDPGLNAPSVAAACRMSPRYLHGLFAREERSFHEHVWTNRLARAHALLSDGESGLPIGEIARLVGFKSAQHFSRAFRRAYGLAPRDARATALTASAS